MPRITKAQLAALIAQASGVDLRHQLLLDHLVNPVAMRGDRHLAMLQMLSRPAASVAPPEFALRCAQQDGDDADDVEEVWPWEEPLYTVQGGVAELHINGPLLKGYDPFICWWYGYYSVDRLQDALAEIAADPAIASVLLRISSPGGVVTGIPETARQIAQLGRTKLTVAVTDTMACSAAYWLACHAGQFLATSSADVGSIGTYIALYDYSEMLKTMGIKLDLFRRGKFKGIGVMGKALTAEERKFLDEDCGKTNDRFTSAVRSQRGQVADETMQGQWFDGEEALSRNLVDGLVASVGEVRANLRQALSRAVAGS